MDLHRVSVCTVNCEMVKKSLVDCRRYNRFPLPKRFLAPLVALLNNIFQGVHYSVRFHYGLDDLDNISQTLPSIYVLSDAKNCFIFRNLISSRQLGKLGVLQ